MSDTELLSWYLSVLNRFNILLRKLDIQSAYKHWSSSHKIEYVTNTPQWRNSDPNASKED